MYCKNCGNKISEGAKFCKSCGAPAVEPSEKRETEQARRESIRREKAKKRRKIL
ncbi:zinc ribbon domain-containing protein, partial [Pseudomonas aeruginosa]|nr:zinc ribbon domain-containing protein [Pseudomonas aeruginosa]